MINEKDIENLSKLARIELNEEEKKSLTKDLDRILGFIGEIGEISADLPDISEAGKLKNVMREDENPYESNASTKELLESAPETEKDYIKVQNIL